MDIKCHICDSESNIEEVVKPYIMAHMSLGEVVVPDVLQICCYNCGTCLRLPAESSKKVSDFWQALLADTIKELPIGDFVSARTALSFLDLPQSQKSYTLLKQKRSMLLSTVIAGSYYYYKPSITAVRFGYDGRLDISWCRKR
jgi:hypothetical protein